MSKDKERDPNLDALYAVLMVVLVLAYLRVLGALYERLQEPITVTFVGTVSAEEVNDAAGDA